MNITSIIIIIEFNDLNKHNLKYKTFVCKSSHSLCYRHELFINYATWGEAVLLFICFLLLFYFIVCLIFVLYYFIWCF